MVSSDPHFIPGDSPPPPPPAVEPDLDLAEAVVPEANPYALRPRHIPLDLPGRPHPGFAWSLIWCVVFFFVTQVPGSIIAIVVAFLLYLKNPDFFPKELDVPSLMRSRGMSIAFLVAFFITEFLVIGFSWLMTRLVVGKQWGRQLGLRLPAWWHLALVLAAFLPTALLANVVYLLFKSVLPSLGGAEGTPGMEQMVEMFSSWPWPLAVLIIGVGPGIGEELWCRGFLGRGLVGHYGVLVGVLLTSFFFGLIHVDPVQGSMAMVLGLWLHFTYLATRSLLVPMLLHFLNNSLSVVASRFSFLDALDQPQNHFSLALIWSSLIVVAAVAYALYQSRVRPVGFVGLPTLGGLGTEHPAADSSWHLAYPPPSPLAIALVGLATLGFAVCFGLAIGAG